MFVSEPQREIPVVREVDVLVVGGGTAGVPAALCAARLGARTLLVEKFNSLGGAITQGLTITLPPYPVVGKAMNGILHRIQTKYGAVANMDHPPYFVVLDQELYKYESILALEEAGAEVLLDSYAVDAVVREGAVRGIVLENKSGRQAVLARVTIDCTGDADVAFRAGAATATAPRDRILPVTLMWLAANVFDKRGGADTVIHENEVNVWGGSLSGIDGTDAWELTRAEIGLRKASVAEWLNRRANWPGWEKSYIGFMAPHLGVRETRRLVGQHVVSEAEMGKTTYEDAIGTMQYDLQLPYRCLVPREVNGLLVAGRCSSMEPPVQHRIRIAPSCALLGEVAGVAAALSIRGGIEPRRLPVDKLQAQLKEQGVWFGALSDLPKTLQA